MTYLDDYFARVNNFGSTPRDKSTNLGIREFDNMLNASAFTNLLTYQNRNGSDHAIVYHNRESELRNQIFVSVRNSSNFSGGDIFYWDDSYWIAVFNTIMPVEAYKKFNCYKCTTQLNWYNTNGVYYSTPTCFIGSGSTFVNDLEQSTQDIIRGDQNKGAVCVIPDGLDIQYGQRFVLQDEAWKAIDIDKHTVNGVWFVSIEYDELNDQLDDVTNGVAYHTPIDTVVTNNSIGNSSYVLEGNTNLRWGYTELYTVKKYNLGTLTNFNCLLNVATNALATYTAISNNSFSLLGDSVNASIDTIHLKVYDNAVEVTNFNINLIPYWL